MSENNASNRKLTLDDPVGADTLEKLRELEGVEIDAAMQLMALEQTKIKLLAAGRRVEDIGAETAVFAGTQFVAGY